MEIRFVPDTDKEAIKRIEAYCFLSPIDNSEFFVENVFKPENCLGSYDGDRLGATLHILPYEIFFYDNVVPMGGIASVATLPEYRNCHCASSMLIEALKIMRERGQVFSVLNPFSFSFYRKYGWEMAFHTREYNLLITDLKGFGKGKGNFQPLSYRDIPAITKVYESFMIGYNGGIRRRRENWELLFKRQERDGHYRYGYQDESGKLQGYIFYHIKDGKFHIGELMYTSLEVKLELFRFIYYHSAQADRVVWQAPADDNTLLMLNDPRREQKLIPGMMMRIVDIKKALEVCPFPHEYSGSFFLGIEDQWAPWNEGVFKVVIMKGRAEVEDAGREQWDIRCSIQDFSQMISGYISIKDAVEAGKLEMRSSELLKKVQNLFPARGTFMNDFF